MDVAFRSPAFFLLLTGAFGVSVGHAVARRDGPSTLAMGVAFVATAHLAGLPAWLLVWGCTIVTIALGMSLAALLLRWIAGSDAYRIGMIGTLAVAVSLVAQHEYLLPSATAVLGDRSLAFGNLIHQQIETLVPG